MEIVRSNEMDRELCKCNDVDLKEACVKLSEREQNDGSWVGGKIPSIFHTIQKKYFPTFDDDGVDVWLHVVIQWVSMQAVHRIARDLETK